MVENVEARYLQFGSLRNIGMIERSRSVNALEILAAGSG